MLFRSTKQIKDSKKIVIVTGAGISKESGIPTFRGSNGLWRKYDPMKLATIDAFNQNPVLVWEWYEERRANILTAKPNAGHYAISELEKYKDVTILTQNIDGLHQRAGSKTVLELHGNIIRTKCTVCNFKENLRVSFETLPPKCNCGNILRPDVVWFGEELPHDVWREAISQAQNCDLMLIVGTSLVVSPANSLPLYAKQNGAKLIEINPEKTPMSSEMNLSLRATSVESLPRLVDLVSFC